MNLLDKKIICELELNSRASYSKIARNLKISRSVVEYRINKLKEQKIILKYICSVNLGALGFKTYKLAVKLKKHDLESEKQFIDIIQKHKEIINAVKTEGAYNFSLALAVKNIQDLDKFINIIKPLVNDVELNIVVYSRIFKLHKLLLDKSQIDLKKEKYQGEDKINSLDKKDEAILRVISQNAELTTRSIAKKINSSIDIVSYRLKKLQNIITNRVMFDLNKMGFYHYVILIKLAQGEDKKLIGWCEKNKQVMYYTKRISNFEYAVHIGIKNIDELNNIISNLKETINVEDYKLALHTQILKLNYVPF